MGVLISDLTAAGTLDGDDLVELLADPGSVPSSRKVTLDELGAQAHRLGVRTVSTGTATITAADAGLPVYFSTTCTLTLNDIADGTKVMLIPAGGDLTLVAGSGVSSVVPATVIPQYNTVWAVKFGTAWLVVPNFKLANALGDVVIDVDPAGNGSTKRIDVTSAEGVRIEGASSTKRLNVVPDTYAGVAPPRGLINRFAVSFAKCRVSLDTVGNTAATTVELNISSATWISDTQVDFTFRNAASSAELIVVATPGWTTTVRAASFSTTGFSVIFGTAPSGTGFFYVDVSTRDLT